MKWAVAIIILLAASAGGAFLYKRKLDAPPPPVAAIVPQAVSTEPVRVATMVDHVASYGNLVSDRVVNIVPETAGQVKQILFDDGQLVLAGTALVQMDSSIVEAQLESSRAQADSDMQNLRRIQSLSRQGLDSTYSLEQAQSRASASQADVKINERKLAQLTLRAPFSGTLGSALVDVGAYVNSGSTIVRLQDTTELQIEFRMPSTVALKVAQGIPVHVEVPGSSGDRKFEGKLSFIDPAISTDTRSVLLRAVVSNAGRQLRPGLYVRVNLDLAVHKNALVVPIVAIGSDLASSYVFVVDGQNVAHQRSVTIGLTNGEQAEVLNGVKAGEEVVVVGQFKLRDGDTVRIVPIPADVKSAT
jgi:membrane fusion protein (multidrug efflux system)